MDSRTSETGELFEAINGGHLHWSDFRENVLGPFRINCTASPTAKEFPKPFLSRLSAAQQNLTKHDAQRLAWRRDVSAGRGLTSLTVFPPNLVPPQSDSSQTLRCISPRMSREGLPLRSPDSKGSLYELPTAKPIYVFGFDMNLFSKPEQAHLTGPLHVTGTSVDFVQGNVSPFRTLCCPFLAFEKFDVNSKGQIESARNSCAITGAQCLRGQQQLFHKAFGLQTVSQPPITFTCALNNEQAIINYHSVGEDGEYKMAALCKFDLQDDEHFNTFQAWIEAIESWAAMYLLPRIQVAVSEVLHSNPTPPPSPTPSTSSLLSIDTKSTDVLTILGELRHLCPTVTWHNNDMTVDTPINSSIAQCGTPLPTREIRFLSLSRPASPESMSSSDRSSGSERSLRSPPISVSGLLSPIRPDLPLLERRRFLTAAQYRLNFSPTLSQSDGSGTPISPCRPGSLSPCTPGPDMPMSSMNPILVLQRRLDVAVTEIQELRDHVDDLQEQLNCRTAALEQRLAAIIQGHEYTVHSVLNDCDSSKRSSPCIISLEGTPGRDMKTPTRLGLYPYQGCSDSQTPIAQNSALSLSTTMPGFYHQTEDEGDIVFWKWPLISEDIIIYCLARVLQDDTIQLSLLASLAITMSCTGLISPPNFCANAIFVIVVDQYAKSLVWRWYAILRSWFRAARETRFEEEHVGYGFICESDVDVCVQRVDDDGGGDGIGIGDDDHDIDLGKLDIFGTECVPVVLC